VLNTLGQTQTDVQFYTERAPIGTYLRTRGRVSFTMATLLRDTLIPDTLYRIDMTMLGKTPDPEHLASTTGDHTNYYRDTLAVTDAHAYQRIVYHSLEDSVDAHFYYGSSGPRMAFVLRPGADPNTLKLTFTGQDSLHVDWQGALRIYLEEKWISLQEALAFQVDAEDNIIPVDWTAGYVLDQDDAYVSFEFGEFDTGLPLVLQI